MTDDFTSGKIWKIKNKPYHKIQIEDINPYSHLTFKGTVYLMGSPGSGKSRFVQRIASDGLGALVLESGVFDLYQRYLRAWKAERDRQGLETYMLEDDFDMPNIDGFHPFLDMTGLGDESTIVSGAPYRGIGSGRYRESLSNKIKSGGKSGFPDWVFIPGKNEGYYQVVTIPGHLTLEEVMRNQSIPQIPTPASAIFLVDPQITDYNHDIAWIYGDDGESITTYLGGNPALQACGLHLREVLTLEERGIPVQWYISKTPDAEINNARNQVRSIYSADSNSEIGSELILQNFDKPLDHLKEIARRAGRLPCFDSYASSKEQIMDVLRSAGIEI